MMSPSSFVSMFGVQIKGKQYCVVMSPSSFVSVFGVQINGKEYCVVMSPSSFVSVFGSNHLRQHVRRRVGVRWKEECLQPSVKHGEEAVMV